MATKDQRLPSKATVEKLDSSNDEYKNINLNKNHQSPTLNIVQSNSNSCNNQKKINDYTSVETKSKHKKSHGWNKEDTHQLQQCFSTNGAETDKFKINGKTSTTSSDSTLSLEIEKYENSGGNSDKETTETKKELWKTRNEIPRQQDDNDASKTPEIMPFKKSHKLLNPNQPHSEYKKLIDNANQLYKARRFKDAAKAYSDILSFTRLTSTEKAVVYYNRSTTYMKLISLKNALRQARKDAEKAIELDPTWWKGYYRLATVFIETEKWAESKDLLSKALTLDPTNVTIKDALSTVEYGIFEDSLNYQERRSLHDILNFDNLKISADEEEEAAVRKSANLNFSSFEVKRSGEANDDYDYLYDNIHNNNDVSLTSDISNTSVDNESDVIVIDTATESVIDDVDITSKIDKTLTSKDLLLISLGLDNSFANHEVPFPPLDIPYKKGNYLFIVNAETIANMGDVISTDKLSPWNNKEKGVRSKQYYIHYEAEANCVKKYTRTDSKRDPFKTYCFEYQTSHHEFPVSKKIIAICQPNDKNPIEGTKVCFYYEVTDNSEDMEKLVHKIHNPRIAPSDSGKLKQLLMNKNAPSEALHLHQQTSSLMDSVTVVTQTQVNNLARHLKDRSPPTNKGQKKTINFDEILKMAHDQRFVMEFTKSGEDIKIFCGVKAAFSMIESSLVSAASMNELSKEIEKALKLQKNLRYQKLSEIVNSENYQNSLKTCCFYLDTTFNVSELYLTILLCSSPFLIRTDGTPVCIIGGIMLSSQKDALSYEWMGMKIQKYLSSKSRFARSITTDADLSLDAILKAEIFAPPCVKLQCGEHLDTNIDTYIDAPQTKQRIKHDIFGFVEGEIRLKSLSAVYFFVSAFNTIFFGISK